MRALYFEQFGGLEVLQVGEQPTPEPGPGEALVRVSVAGLNYVDTLLFRGIFDPGLPLPHINGVECVGTVEAVGPRGDEALVGRLVAVNPLLSAGRIIGEHAKGGHAELLVAPAANCVPVPEGLGDEEATAAIVSIGSPYDAIIRDGQLKPGETLLVWAAGSGTGVGAVQVGRLVGARVLATAGSPEKMERARSLGAEVVINHHEDDVVSKVLQATGGRGADVIFESTGAETLPKSVAAAAEDARILIYGVVTGFQGNLELGRVIMRRLKLIGSFYGPSPAQFRQVLELVAKGRLKPVIADVVGLAEAPDAYRRIEAGKIFGKVLIRLEG
ncbi:MAG: zinc-binding dehydrogenase [bacterium]|nr:zinc-binding dehydrogenase [bacterium]